MIYHHLLAIFVIIDRLCALVPLFLSHITQVWACESLRDQFLALPYPAVRCLLASEGTTVATENTALVVLTGWVEEGLYGRNATAAQRKELLNLVSS